MINFGHEIPCPTDRAMRKFLWFDYFHDGEIQRIEYAKPDRESVTITTRAVWESDEIFKTLKGTREDRCAQFEAFLPRVTYHLRFHGVKYFRHVMDDGWNAEDEFRYMHFKDSPLLHRLQKDNRKPLYHLRAETSWGLLDVVFERFTLRKQEGRVDYRCDWDVNRDFWENPMNSYGQYLREDRDDEEVTGMDDYDLNDVMCCRLYKRHRAGYIPEALELAREIIRTYQGRLYHAESYAAYLLGLHGDESDLPALTKLYLCPELGALPKQNMLDAIERIHERAEEAAHD